MAESGLKARSRCLAVEHVQVGIRQAVHLIKDGQRFAHNYQRHVSNRTCSVIYLTEWPFSFNPAKVVVSQ